MKDFDKIVEKKGLIVTPANWISLRGEFTPEELRLIADGVEKNYTLIRKDKTHGNTKRHNSNLGSES